MSVDNNHGPCGSEATRLSCMSDVLFRTQETHNREIHRRATLAPAINLAPKLNVRNKTRIEVLNRRYPGRLELRAPQEATLTTLRMQAQTAARFEDVLAHVTLTGAGGKGSRQVPCGTRPEYGTRGISHPRSGRVPAGAPPTRRPLLAFRADGGVVWFSDGAPLPRPPRVF